MRTNKLLWIVQGLLAALFLFAGGVKLVLPVEAMQQGPVALPGRSSGSSGCAKSAGPPAWCFRGRSGFNRVLTPLAARGLMVIMTGATVLTAIGGQVAGALFPLAVGMLLTVVAYQRTRCTV